MKFKQKIQKLFEKKKIVTFMDIASDTITCIVLSFKEDNTFQVIGYTKNQSLGIRKGAIVDINLAVQSLGKVVEEIEKQTSLRLSKVVVGCLLPLSKHVVYPYVGSVDSVVDNDKLYSIFSPEVFKERVDYSDFLLHLFAENMLFDDVAIDNPNGLYVDRIKADVHMISASYSGFVNLIELLNFFALSPELVLHSPLASGYGAMSKEESGLSALSIELSYDTTSYCLYKDDVLLKTGVVDFGLEDIVKELAKELSISFLVAKKLFDYYSSMEDKNDDASIHITHGKKAYNIQSSLVGYKIKQGYKNIFSQVSKQAMKNHKTSMLDKIILTGLGASYNGLEDICKEACDFINYSSFNIVKRLPAAKYKGDLSFSDNILYGMIKYYLSSRDFDFGMRYFAENIEKKLMR